MRLEQALKQLINIKAGLTEQTILDPTEMSRCMTRIAMYTSIVEDYLATYEKNYEIEQSTLFNKYLRNDKLSASAAEKEVKIELGVLRGDIAYLSRIVASAWKTCSILQSRINHIQTEINTGKHTP